MISCKISYDPSIIYSRSTFYWKSSICWLWLAMWWGASSTPSITLSSRPNTSGAFRKTPVSITKASFCAILQSTHWAKPTDISIACTISSACSPLLPMETSSPKIPSKMYHPHYCRLMSVCCWCWPLFRPALSSSSSSSCSVIIGIFGLLLCNFHLT